MKNQRAVVSPQVVIIAILAVLVVALLAVFVVAPAIQNSTPTWTSRQVALAGIQPFPSACQVQWINTSAHADRFCLWTPQSTGLNWTFDHGVSSGKVYGFGCTPFGTCRGTETWISGNTTGMLAYTVGQSFVTISAHS